MDLLYRFVVRAAGAAHRREHGEDTLSPRAAARASVAAETEDAEIPPARAWFRKNWAYLVGGLLLAGVVAFFIIRGRRDDSLPPPVLRFRTGAE